jgi:hypothetical protein
MNLNPEHKNVAVHIEYFYMNTAVIKPNFKH